MRIGIDARPIQGRFTGDATYWRGFISGLSQLELSDEVSLYLDPRLDEPELPDSPNIRAKYISAPNWRIWSLWAFPKALRNDGIDIAHVQYGIPPGIRCPVITSIHDISFKRCPEYFKCKDRLILDYGIKTAAKKASKILAISEYTKDEIMSLYHIPDEKIEVVYAGVDAQYQPQNRENSKSFVKEKYGIEQPFILTVGVIQPRKNLHRLLQGFAKFKGIRAQEHKLVIVGKHGWIENLRQRIEELDLTEDVILTGYAPYEDLPFLYSAADVFVYPSVYEGFGLPPLEAMACGTPVITGNRTSLPEVVGEAGIMVDPFSHEAFASAMEKVLQSESLRNDMSRRGLEQAKKFSWRKMAREILEIYKEIA